MKVVMRAGGHVQRHDRPSQLYRSARLWETAAREAKVNHKTLLLALVLACGGCSDKNLNAPAPIASPAPPKKADERQTATPQQTITEMNLQPITVLDFGLYQLRKEIVPDLEKRLRSQGLLPQAIGPTTGENVLKRGYVTISVEPSDNDFDQKIIRINVNPGSVEAIASDDLIHRRIELESKIVSTVREFFSGSCRDTDNPNLPNSGVCQSATYLQYYFERPSVSNPDEGFVAHVRAAYNLYSLVIVQVQSQIARDKGGVIITCSGPLIRDEVKCKSTVF